MKISQVMTKEVRTAKPGQTIQEAASIMARIDSCAILVEEQERLIGHDHRSGYSR